MKPDSIRLLVLALWLAAAPRLAAVLSVTDLRCEGLREAPQVDVPAPRFSWRLDTDERDVRQTASQLRVVEIEGAGRSLGNAVEPPEGRRPKGSCCGN